MRRILVVVAALLCVCVAGDAHIPKKGTCLPACRASSLQSTGQKSTRTKFVPTQILQTVDAAYPIKSVAFGTVVVEVHVSAEGEIGDVQVVRDIPSLTEQAVKAVKEWKFQAATLGGKPVASIVPVAFTFVRPDLVPRYGGQPKPR